MSTPDQTYTVTVPVSIEVRAPSSQESAAVAEQALALLDAAPNVVGVYADMVEATVDPEDLTPELLARRTAAVEATFGIWADLPPTDLAYLEARMQMLREELRVLLVELSEEKRARSLAIVEELEALSAQAEEEART